MHVLVFLAAMASLAQADSPLSLSLCTKNETIAVQLLTSPGSGSRTCQCQAAPAPDPSMREDYTYTPGVGSHKLHTNAKAWNEARKACAAEGAHLAIVNSDDEAAILVAMLKRDEKLIRHALNAEQALLGIHDLYKEGEWVTVFGEPLDKTGYKAWSATYWGGQPDNYGGNQNCGALINQGGLDDVFCYDKFAYFCELPLTC